MVEGIDDCVAARLPDELPGGLNACLLGGTVPGGTVLGGTVLEGIVLGGMDGWMDGELDGGITDGLNDCATEELEGCMVGKPGD